MTSPAGVQSAGLEWLNLPIRDVDVPVAEFERRWAVEGPKLLADLRGGESVAVHCRGGLGRTGGRRLLGTPPDEAIATVRAARSGAIETTAQEDYVSVSGQVTFIARV